jgi:hypothetical protein
MNSTVLRSRPVIIVTAATLLTTLTLGLAFVVVHRIYDLRGAAVEAPAVPLTAEQARQQVLEPARQFVGAGRLGDPTASYLLMSCRGDDGPPYQGSVYLTFDVPSITETPAYFREIAGAMKARGWKEGLPPNRHPGGRTLARDGLTAVYHRHPDLQGRGVLKIYGECRTLTDHRSDTTSFVDVTAALRR